ncbi:hypothetical protein ACM66B_003356 [Microbotryomycetes sp. NB124-2]
MSLPDWAPSKLHSSTTRLCTPDELLYGQWRLRSPLPQTIRDVTDLYKYRPYKALTTEHDGIVNTWETRTDGLYCAHEYTKLETSETRRKDEARILKVAGWEWKSDAQQRGECRIEQWDWKQVVKRLIMSPGGLVFVGDSITAQQYDSFALLLGNDPLHGPIIERVISPHERRLNAGRALFLNSTHPQTLELLDELKPFKVPRERLDRPIVQVMRSNYLVTQKDIDDLGLNATHGSHELRPTDFDTDLAKLVGHNGTLVELDQGVEGGGWMSSVIVTSVGNWWERYIDASESVSQSLIEFQNVMRAALARLDRLSREQGFTVVYRSVTRGTLSCQDYQEPIERTNMTAMDQIGEYAWYLKQPMADMWRSLLSGVVDVQEEEDQDDVVERETQERQRPRRRRKSRWLSLDIADMSYQRPEAHRYPPTDCLHWCLPSVLDDWNWALWHLLQSNEPM